MPEKSPILFKRNDQKLFAERALASAAKICQANDARLTAQRKTILEIILLSTTPIGAYEVLEQLCRSVGKQIVPMTVYRAIDFLIEQRLIHRIASLNAYVACDHPEHSHNSYFFICTGCGQTAELRDKNIEKAIQKEAKRAGFTVGPHLLEVSGLCYYCQDQG